MRIVTEHLKEHGSGPYYAWVLRFGKGGRLFVRVGKGGYGCMPRSEGGCYSPVPRIKRYRKVATHFNFLSYFVTVGRCW